MPSDRTSQSISAQRGLSPAVLASLLVAALPVPGDRTARAGELPRQARASPHETQTLPPSSPPGSRATDDRRIDDLVSRLTVDEKLSLVRGGSDPHQYGQIGYTNGVPRLGIPARRDADAFGINVYLDSTAIPTRLGVAASFDRDAARRLGKLEGNEGRALHMDLLYAPHIDLARTPFWARNLTTYGEDPYLAGQMAVGEIGGIQSQGLMAEVKHLAFYNGQDETIPSAVDEQAAHELYLAPFETAVRLGRPSSVMCSYAIFAISSLAPEPKFACDSTWLLGTVLRGRWGFDGFVLSDYGAAHGTGFLLSGLDAVFPEGAGRKLFGSRLKPLVDPASRRYDRRFAAALDASVARILREMQRFGLLEPSQPVRPPIHREEHASVAQQLSQEAAVLLKNEGELLPLADRKLGKVAVIGPVSNMLVSSPGGERSRGFGDRNLLSPLSALAAAAPDAHLLSTPGIDRIGVIVPSSHLRTGRRSGLRRRGSDGSRQVDPTIDVSLSTGLAPGVSYTWSGEIFIPTRDTYAIWLQTTPGKYCLGKDGERAIDPTGACVPPVSAPKIEIDGIPVNLDKVESLLSNTYPDGLTVNGQYLGLATTGAYIDYRSAAPGWHSLLVRYRPDKDTVRPAIIRLRWAPLFAGMEAAVKEARDAAIALVLVDDASVAKPATGPKPHGVPTLGDYQDELVSRVARANPNIAVVLYTRNPVLMPWLRQVRSVLEMWYPGQEGGTATANLILGRAVPGGKLPITFPAASEDTPFFRHPERVFKAAPDGFLHWDEGLFMGYRWYDHKELEPLFPFGHGLSYTRFAYSRLRVTPSADGGLDVCFRLRNVGRIRGAEVAQVYLGPSPAASSAVQQAPRKLVQFERTVLSPGEDRDLSLHVTKRELSHWSHQAQDFVPGGGTREVFVGSSSRDLRLKASTPVGRESE